MPNGVSNADGEGEYTTTGGGTGQGMPCMCKKRGRGTAEWDASTGVAVPMNLGDVDGEGNVRDRWNSGYVG